MKLPTLTTSKMPGETEQQYTAWLLYCEVGSVTRMMRAWEHVRNGIGDATGILGEKFKEITALPSRRNVEKWSTKYRWIERRDLKLKEDLEVIRDRSKKTKEEKLHRIADAFEQATSKVLRWLRKGGEPTIAEWKQVWEMFRTELGENIGKHEIIKGIDESQQTPPTEEEKELGRVLDDAIKEHYRKQGLKKHGKDV